MTATTPAAAAAPVFGDLAGKSVLVTGALRGIGRETALLLASQGARVAFSHREGREDAARGLARELLAAGAAAATPLAFDSADGARARAVLSAFAGGADPPITGLVNNAGVSRDRLLPRIREEDLRETLATNLEGAVLAAAALSRGFLRAGGASVVNVSSVVGLHGNPGQTSYAASKAGLVGFTKSMARELGGKGVRCNAVCPGLIDTDMTGGLGEAARGALLDRVPLGRAGTPGDVARAVAFLLSDASSYITGQAIKIDGGLYI